MALSKCKECGGSVSTKAKHCTKCGAPVKKNVSGCGLTLAAILVVGIIVVVIGATSSNPSRDDRGEGATGPAEAPEGQPISDSTDPAVKMVADAIAKNNKLGITPSELRIKPNPAGKGTFVYIPKTQFYGVTRNHIWLALYAQAFALNGPSKTLTPSLPWPREAPESVWKMSGLDKSSATQAIKLVYGSQQSP